MFGWDTCEVKYSQLFVNIKVELKQRAQYPIIVFISNYLSLSMSMFYSAAITLLLFMKYSVITF